MADDNIWGVHSQIAWITSVATDYTSKAELKQRLPGDVLISCLILQQNIQNLQARSSFQKHPWLFTIQNRRSARIDKHQVDIATEDVPPETPKF